jgi:lipopolysaccharide transport system permease protein
MQFIIRMMIYTAPIVYSASAIPAGWRFIYSLNPIVSVVEGFRACLLGTPVPWLFVMPGMVVGIVLFATGALYFRRMERLVVDVI